MHDASRSRQRRKKEKGRKKDIESDDNELK